MVAKRRVLSGMQPTGELHLGNYFGALQQWARISRDDEYDALFCVVDAHAITVDYPPRELPGRVLHAVASYVAGGIDPERSTIFLQSDVPQHMELTWYLTTLTPMGDLQRMTQFKDKSDQHKQNVNAGLFTYPILMAADILLYKADVVPVGDDQLQHLELTRELCRKFNRRFGEVFPEPKPLLSRTPRIMGLDGKTKMSKSLDNTIGLLDDSKLLKKKLRSAYTDPLKLRQGDPGHPDRCNLFTLHGALEESEALDEIEAGCRSGALGCGACKQRLGESLGAHLAPIRERALELEARPEETRNLLRSGAVRARELAEATMREVRAAMGLTTSEPPGAR